MKRLLLPLFLSVLLYSCFVNKKNNSSKDNDENDNPMARNLLEIRKIQDPALGYVPTERFMAAFRHTEQLRNMSIANRSYLPLVWEARGPIYDSVGPSNGNGRGGSGTVANKNLGGYTSGRIRAFLLDTLNDPTGNTALTGGVAGGVWRCTNFLSAEPNWTVVDENFTGLSISSIGQDPVNPQIIYVSTGEPTNNADAVYGNGIYKSTDGGRSFQWLPSTANFLRSFKIGCDAAGNVYMAASARGGTSPAPQRWGLFRSNNGGADWTDISPAGLTSSAKICTDFEITSSGILNAIFGYSSSSTAVTTLRYTANPATVTPDTWSTSTGFRSASGVRRSELAVAGEVLYAVTTNTSSAPDSCYKSSDGGLTWTKQNSAILPSGLSTQGWYNLSLAINPSNTNELTVGALDIYRSQDAGANWSRLTYWVSTLPYVHADHHFNMYWIKDGETRIILATDGGIFYSTDNGATFVNKNKNLDIKQFYSAAIHPDAGSNYMLAGAQDNGSHQFKNPGLSYTTEVTGGDGAFVHINQLNPSIQFTSYTYNSYRRSTNGGATWSNVNYTDGEFINPYDYDDANNIMYASLGNLSQMRRWPNANTATTTTRITFPDSLLGGAANVSLVSFKVSPYTANRLFFGTDNGRFFRMENANTVTSSTVGNAITNIGSANFSTGGYISCVNTGTSDDNLVVVFSNYGVNNVWVTTNGGTTWSAIDGDLPDMPVRWALFEPGDNNKLFIATEAGIYTTTNINGASTKWLPEPGFPPVRTDMIKIRNSDSTIVAATHGRGVYTAKIPPCAPNTISDQPDNKTVCTGDDVVFTVATSGPQVLYQWQVSTDGGTTYTDIAGATGATLTVSSVTTAMNGYRYRCITDTYCSGKLTSDAATLTVNTPAVITNCVPDKTVSNDVGQCGAVVTYAAPSVTGSPAPTITYSHPSGTLFPVGTTTVTVIATNDCDADTCTFTVTVNDTEKPVVTCPANSTQATSSGACTASVTSPDLTAGDNCAVTLQTWAITGATTGNSAATGINNIGTRTFNLGVSTVTYTVRDAAGNTTTCSYTVTVTDGQMPVINTQPATTTVCAGTTASFSVVAVTAPVAGGTLNYQWQQWNGNTWNNIAGATAATLTLSNVTHAMNTNTYRVNITGSCTAVTSAAATLRVNPLPAVTINASPSPVLIPGRRTTLTTVVNPSGGSYVWLLNGQPTGATGATLPGLTVDNIGSYTVRYTDPNGCVTTSAALEVIAQQSDLMWVYPNPNQGQFQVRVYSAANTPFTLNVFDAKGAKVFSKTTTPTQAYTTIPVDLGKTTPMGVYVVELRDNTGKRLGSKQISVNH